MILIRFIKLHILLLYYINFTFIFFLLIIVNWEYVSGKRLDKHCASSITLGMPKNSDIIYIYIYYSNFNFKLSL